MILVFHIPNKEKVDRQFDGAALLFACNGGERLK